MAQKPKARAAAPKASHAEKQKAQSERFIKAAREFGVDESGKDFDRAMKKITARKAKAVP